MYPHRIELNGPWDCEPLARTALHADGRIEDVPGDVPPHCRLALPCRWSDWAAGGLGPFTGRVRFHRRFHWPGTLDYYERLWLLFAGVDYFARVWLNGQELGMHEGAFDPFEFDITPLVALRNDLVVEVDLPEMAGVEQRLLRSPPACPPDSGGIWAPVAVEVRREAFLRNVRIFSTIEGNGGTLHVHGEAVGEVDHPLELYLLLDGTTVVYQRIRAGKPFQVTAPLKDIDRWRPEEPHLHKVQVDLIDGASQLDSRLVDTGFRTLAAPAQVIHTANEPFMVTLEGHEHHATGLELTSPLLKWTGLDEADRLGRLHVLRLPLVGRFATDEATRLSLVRQTEAIVGHLQHHPSLVGWLLHRDAPAENAELDAALFAAVRRLDPTRPCWVGGGE